MALAPLIHAARIKLPLYRKARADARLMPFSDQLYTGPKISCFDLRLEGRIHHQNSPGADRRENFPALDWTISRLLVLHLLGWKKAIDGKLKGFCGNPTVTRTRVGSHTATRHTVVRRSETRVVFRFRDEWTLIKWIIRVGGLRNGRPKRFLIITKKGVWKKRQTRQL